MGQPQIPVIILLSTLVVFAQATEKKPFYERLHEPGDLFHLEDYHADLVLGMLPEIKSSIREFRTRNFNKHDIENIYQGLTIFWPVVRKYLHIKEDLVDNAPSEIVENYNQISKKTVSEHRNNVDDIHSIIHNEFDISRNEIGKTQISENDSQPFKNEMLFSYNIRSDQRPTSNSNIRIPKPEFSGFSKNMQYSPLALQSTNRRKVLVGIRKIEPSSSTH